MKRSPELEDAAVRDVARLMTASARTAPKTRGIDNIEIIEVDDAPEKDALIKKMKAIASSENRRSFERDAQCIANCRAIVVIGVKSNPAGLNCGFCGHATCESLTKALGICAYNSIDLGIAVCSAADTASRAHADNRVMY